MNESGLKVFNTLTGKKEAFIPLEPGKVRIYVCGPTTYNLIHLGNARPLVVFDTVRRYLEHLGYQVTYVQNFTDVDDKIIKRAREENVPPSELAERYVREYYKDSDALMVKRATVHPRVSEHMDDIIKFIEGLFQKGYAYEIDGDVYFAVTRFKEYGKLSSRTLDELMAGARVEVDERKAHPADFALWKKSRPGEPWWESPWGPGRPGWHIECSAMSHKYLGNSFDIHAGGCDLIFPHHENEIAQSEALHGVPMAKYWLHNGFITVNEEKMSKSLGNFFLLRDILDLYAPGAVRFYLLSTHYRSPLDFDDEKLETAKKGWDRLRNAYRLCREAVGDVSSPEKQAGLVFPGQLPKEVEAARRQFYEAMNDDFNTALAIAALFDLARTLNTAAAQGIASPGVLEVLEYGQETFVELSGVLGIRLDDSGKHEPALVGQLVDLIIALRQEARAKKDYQTSDKIRENLKQLGIVLEDTPQGVRWRYQ
ncbi:MAG: cysteine--tRNA ligase [Peptococcaceae bacterium]|jgi:cysteinyl-tRNA synthetase|nr:cysteine--tRNA ligase [Peptococcaceae bacterium]MDH7526121.1 cysteine--tRNA ligase [Peptococcaceae bacterium]